MTEPNTELPETPIGALEKVTILENTTKPAPFSPEQQVVFDRAVKEAQGRAGRAAREEAARLKLENERLQALAVGNSPDASEVEKLRAQLADEKLRASAADARAVAQEKQVYQSRLAAQVDAVDASAVSKLLADNLVNRDGKWVVLDDAGVERVGADGVPVTPEILYNEFALSHPWAIKGRTINGTGQGGSTGSAPPAALDWRRYVGSHSSAADANRLAQRDPRAYAEMKRQARAAGAIA